MAEWLAASVIDRVVDVSFHTDTVKSRDWLLLSVLYADIANAYLKHCGA